MPFRSLLRDSFGEKEGFMNIWFLPLRTAFGAILYFCRISINHTQTSGYLLLRLEFLGREETEYGDTLSPLE